MAEGKKSFVLYADLMKSIEHLTNEEKGILFNHLLEYVNDMNPVLEDRLLMTAWKPIEVQLKRDLQRWDEKVDKRSEAGMKSAGKKSFDKWLKESLTKGVDKISSDEHLFEAGRCYKFMNESHGTYMFYHYQYAREWHQQMSTNSTHVDSVQQTPTKSTDSVSVNVSVNDTVNVNEILLKKEPKENIFDFKSSLISIGVLENVASDWMKVRKNKKASNTETAFKIIVSEINKTGRSPNECITEAVARSWQGFKAEWITNNQNNGSTKTNQQPTNGRQTLSDRMDAVKQRAAAKRNQQVNSEGTHIEPFSDFQNVD